MKTHNHNLAITHLAMPERRIPVLIDESAEDAEGFVPSPLGNDRDVVRVRRLEPKFLTELRSSQKRRDIERKYGAIPQAEWRRLRELFSLLDRVNDGDLSPIITSNTDQVLEELPAQLDQLSPRGWLREETNERTDEISFVPVLGNPQGQARLTIRIGALTFTESERESAKNEPAPTAVYPVAKQSGRDIMGEFTIHGTIKTVTAAISEAFTEGMSKTRFVVWWSDIGRKLVPGLYCPDIVTALYALAMWSYGTAGGWAICQKCNSDFARRRAKQLYCSGRCQAAAGMVRLRQKRKNKPTI